MAVTYGFYNSINGDRKYNAEQMSAIFDGIIRDGVFQDIGATFRVYAEADSAIIVDTGKAWFNSTWILNDALLRLTAEPADVLQKRIDAVVIEINKDNKVRANSIKIIKGIPSTSPKKPTMERGKILNQYPIAYIERKVNDNSITNADIEFVVGRSECPFINGILQTANIDTQLNQYTQMMRDVISRNQNEFERLVSETNNGLTDWIDNIKRIFQNTDISKLAMDIDKANRVIEVTLTVTGWNNIVVGGINAFAQSVTVPEIDENSMPLLVKMPLSDPSRKKDPKLLSYLKQYDREFAKITTGFTRNRDVRFVALQKPTIDLPVGLKGV